jgi:hypothetical protein
MGTSPQLRRTRWESVRSLRPLGCRHTMLHLKGIRTGVGTYSTMQRRDEKLTDSWGCDKKGGGERTSVRHNRTSGFSIHPPFATFSSSSTHTGGRLTLKSSESRTTAAGMITFCMRLTRLAFIAESCEGEREGGRKRCWFLSPVRESGLLEPPPPALPVNTHRLQVYKDWLNPKASKYIAAGVGQHAGATLRCNSAAWCKHLSTPGSSLLMSGVLTQKTVMGTNMR